MVSFTTFVYILILLCYYITILLYFYILLHGCLILIYKCNYLRNSVCYSKNVSSTFVLFRGNSNLVHLAELVQVNILPAPQLFDLTLHFENLSFILSMQVIHFSKIQVWYFLTLLHSTELLYFIEKLTFLPFLRWTSFLTFLTKKIYCQSCKKYSFSSFSIDSTLLVISITVIII